MRKQYKLATFLIILCLCFFVTGFNQNIQSKNINVGDYVKFGNYPQTAKDEVQPIEWQVLAKEGNKILIISKYGLDAKRFDDNSNDWASSEIRYWLNDKFYNKAFTEKEKKSINSSNLSDVGTSDKVFLLSKEEAENYFVNDKLRRCKATGYAVKKVLIYLMVVLEASLVIVYGGCVLLILILTIMSIVSLVTVISTIIMLLALVIVLFVLLCG